MSWLSVNENIRQRGIDPMPNLDERPRFKSDVRMFDATPSVDPHMRPLELGLCCNQPLNPAWGEIVTVSRPTRDPDHPDGLCPIGRIHASLCYVVVPCPGCSGDVRGYFSRELTIEDLEDDRPPFTFTCEHYGLPCFEWLAITPRVAVRCALVTERYLAVKFGADRRGQDEWFRIQAQRFGENFSLDECVPGRDWEGR